SCHRSFGNLRGAHKAGAGVDWFGPMSKTKVRKILLGFDFYGAGNVGDDLMLQGFLASIPPEQADSLHFACITPHQVASQRQRFKQIEWFASPQVNREEMLSQCDYWLGVGDTPFQITCGSWFLDKILNDLRLTQRHGLPMHMIGIGAEEEVLQSAEKA